MKICSNCFKDTELKAYISSSTKQGDCEVCKSLNVPVIKIDDLYDYFQELINNFKLSKPGKPLISIIQDKWSFFSSLNIAEEILNTLLNEIKTDVKNANCLVDYADEILDNVAYWEQFKEDIKWSQRFVLDIKYLTEELGWDGFFNTGFMLTPKDSLFRARVHHKSGMSPYPASQMYCPEPKSVTGGRANPQGIPYLYLCDNPETVLYEVRATYLDELSIGRFILKHPLKELKIVDFTENTPLYQPNKVTETIKSKLLRDLISKDLSKPMRRYDSEIDYIPTQFICEFIRVFTGAAGIRFSSSLHPIGKNYVIFDKENVKCANVKLQKIENLNLSARNIEPTIQ
jgi:hypothetical protein